MTVPDLYDILFDVVAALDQIGEFWLTASFAIVVAAHFTSGTLSRVYAILMGSVYTLLTAFLATRYTMALNRMLEIQDRLRSAGELVPEGLLSFSTALGLATFLSGFCSVLFFLWRSTRKSMDETEN